MKRSVLYLFLVAIISFGIAGCSSYDDSAIKEEIENLDKRLKTVESQILQINDNLSSYVRTLNAIESQDRIESVTPLDDDTGYIIKFTKAGEIIIHNGDKGKDGEDGEDGHSPVIGVRQDSDGTYYWTIDGEFVKDGDGNNIAATAHISTPRVQLSSDGKHYEITFDDGKTWIIVGDVMAEGNSKTIFEKVDESDDQVTFYLTEGGTIIIPKVQTFALIISENTVGIKAGQTVSIPFTVTAADDETIVDGVANNGYAIEVVGVSSGKINITAPSPLVNGKAVIIAVNSKGTTSGKILTFEEGQLTLIVNGTAVASGATTITVQVKTNLLYEIVIPEAAKSWISIVDTKAVHTDTITFSISENTGAARTATIQIVDTENNILESFTIEQASGNQTQDPGYYNSIDDWQRDKNITF